VLAVDTNVLVRFFTRDDPHQAERARAVIVGNEIWISKTVLLETEWVLRRTYKFPAERVISIFQSLAASETVFIEDPFTVAEALRLAADGLDFANALHVASAGSSAQFVTFDADLAKKAKGLARIEVSRV